MRQRADQSDLPPKVQVVVACVPQLDPLSTGSQTAGFEAYNYSGLQIMSLNCSAADKITAYRIRRKAMWPGGVGKVDQRKHLAFRICGSPHSFGVHQMNSSMLTSLVTVYRLLALSFGSKHSYRRISSRSTMRLCRHTYLAESTQEGHDTDWVRSPNFV